MSKKNFLIMSILIVLLAPVSLTNAQEIPSDKKDTQTIMSHDDMQKCIDKIAADSTLRMQMMDKMMMHHKLNKESMMQMCKMMMEGEGMMKCGMMKHNMMCDSIKTMEKTDHDSHNPKK